MKQRLFIAAFVLAPLLWLFGRALLSDETFVFRDAAHYYYPYYKYVAQQWGQGRVPLWNPLENLGQPLLADATAAVLYPGKLIFALPLGYDTNYKLYIVGHVLFAAVSAYVAARGFARSQYAAALCAISYAFSGSVVFQYCNVIFLVGAAWLPLAVLAIDRTLRMRSWRWALALAAILAMMVFGGDPQLAYHVGLVAAPYALILWRAERVGRISYPPTESSTSRSDRKSDLRTLVHRFALLFAAGSFAFVLAAAQILPSMEWTPKTSRAVTDVPRNVYELARGTGNKTDLSTSQRLDFLLGNQENDHHIDSYVFSVGPWHLAGCIWPNVFGNLFPENTRWIRALGAEGRMWTPTLYMGLLPLLLALSQFRWRMFSTGRARLLPSRKQNTVTSSARQEPRPPNDALEDPESNEQTSRRVWLTWIVIFSLLAACGWYGLGWVVIETYHLVAGQDAATLSIGSPLGGVYWLLQTFLPGYVLFRYPAKWLVVVACGMSLLSAYGWDAMVQQSTRFVRGGLLVVLFVSVVAGVVAHTVIYVYPYWDRLRRYVPVDDRFGPLDVTASGIAVVVAVVHGILLSAVLLWLLPRRSRETCPIPAWRTVALLCVVVLDLGVAQRELVPTDSQYSLGPRWGSNRLRGGPPWQRSTLNLPPPRMYRQFELRSWPPPKLYWGHLREQETFYPKHSLLCGIDMLESPSAMTSQEFREFMQAARRTGFMDGDRAFPNPRVLETTGTEFLIVRYSEPLQRAYPVGGYLRDWSLLNVPHLPRARVAYDVQQISEPPPDTSDGMYDRTRIVFAEITREDGAADAVVETPRGLSLSVPELGDSPERLSGHPCKITSYAPDRVLLRAELKQDGLVVLADAFADGWACQVTNRATGETTTEPILRTNRVMRGVWLPAGDYYVVFRYRPMSFYFGATVSVVGWIALAMVGIRTQRSRRRSRDPT